jgi:predicted chitinase
MYTYRITGKVNYNEAETEDGNQTVELNETIETEELGAESALRQFFDDNPQYDDFYSLKTCDAETRGEKGATFKDRTDETRWIDVELVD